MTTGPFDGPFMGDFPSRPDNDDFWKLSELVLQQDGKTEDPNFDFDAYIASVVDPASLTYFREQRVGMALQRAAPMLRRPGGQQIVAESIWLDAFMLGVAFGRRHPEVPKTEMS